MLQAMTRYKQHKANKTPLVVNSVPKVWRLNLKDKDDKERR